MKLFTAALLVTSVAAFAPSAVEVCPVFIVVGNDGADAHGFFIISL